MKTNQTQFTNKTKHSQLGIRKASDMSKSICEDIKMDKTDLQTSTAVEGPVIKVNISENEKRKRAESAGDETNLATNRNVAEGMMDLALLTANANQLRLLISYNAKSSTYFLSMGLIILSLVLQVAVGIGLIFKKKNGKKSRMELTNRLLVVGVFIITFVNVLIAAFTSTIAGD